MNEKTLELVLDLVKLTQCEKIQWEKEGDSEYLLELPISLIYVSKNTNNNGIDIYSFSIYDINGKKKESVMASNDSECYEVYKSIRDLFEEIHKIHSIDTNNFIDAIKESLKTASFNADKGKNKGLIDLRTMQSKK